LKNLTVDRYFIADIKLRILEISNLKKYDCQGMYKIYDCWPDIANNSYHLNHKKIEKYDIEHIVFCGMGGSGAIGDIFESIFSKTKIHVSVVKGYLMPKTVNTKSLIIITSISGNTEEALTVLEEARKINCKIIVLSSGGKIEKLCKKYNLDYRKLPQDHSPRGSFARFLFSILKILDNLIPISESDVEESILELKKLQEQISTSNLSDSNPALELANWLEGIPLIYYPAGLNSAAIRFKNSLQENCKLHVITEDVIEACHNGIVSWEKQSIVKPILLQGKDDFEKTKERWEIVKEYFNEKHIEYREIFSIEGNILSKLINLIYLLDYVTIYYAALNKIDPTTVDSINFIKERL
jgi:glucose/mannose-6-phosphate isomerase